MHYNYSSLGKLSTKDLITHHLYKHNLHNSHLDNFLDIKMTFQDVGVPFKVRYIGSSYFISPTSNYKGSL